MSHPHGSPPPAAGAPAAAAAGIGLPAEWILGLHHVAIAVPSIEQARGTYAGALGLPETPPEHVADQRVNVLVVFAGTQRIELIEPAGPDSPISKFLEKRGPGLHHLAYRVADLAAALAHLRQAGLRLIDQAPRPGAHGTRVAFVHPSSTGGVLTELVELPAPGDSHG